MKAIYKIDIFSEKGKGRNGKNEKTKWRNT